MIKTTHTADALRAKLDISDPDWREKLRADLDELQPGWKSFPLSVWDEAAGRWVDIILLANPESITPASRSFRTRLTGWLGRS